MAQAVVERVERVRSNGLDHAVHHFEPEGAAAPQKTVLLLHGFLDAAATWDLVANELVHFGFRVVAPDFRGFGESARVPEGGYYHFPDYVADLVGIVESLAAPWLGVVGHSMGGGVASLFAGARPDLVTRLVIMEGLGPMADPADLAVERVRKWLSDLRRVDRTPRTLASPEEALDRLAATHPRVDRDVLRSRAARLTRESTDGKLSWAWDPLHRTTSPTPFSPEVFASFLRAISCPTLFLHGGPLGYHPPDEAERLAHIRQLSVIELPDAGHMMHWTAPAAVARAVRQFFSDEPVAES